MFNHLSSRSSVEDWYKHICETQDPRRLTKILISNRSFIDKANLLFALPPTVSEKSVDMRWLESKLEDTGYSQLAQIVRWNIFWRLSKDSRKKNLNWSQKVVVADIKGRWIVQRRTYLQEEIRYLRKFLSVPLISAVEAENKDASKKIYQLSAYEEELQHQDRRIWDDAQHYWKLEVEMPSGCQERAFRAYRKDPNWYLCAWLRQDCAGRGGCCGRDCGCCEKPRATNTAHHRWNQGHCTSACGCCIRTQGRDGCGVKERSDLEDFPLNIPAAKSAYSRRIYRAYIFGLSFADELGLFGYFF